jgi:hypothetical protein
MLLDYRRRKEESQTVKPRNLVCFEKHAASFADASAALLSIAFYFRKVRKGASGE